MNTASQGGAIGGSEGDCISCENIQIPNKISIITKKGTLVMASNRKTSASVAKSASKALRAPTSSASTRRIAASALSQRAPQPKRKKK